MSGGIAKFIDAEAALEAGDAVETVVDFVFLDDAPEIVALNSPFASVAHSFHMEERSAGILRAKLGRDAVMVGGLVAVEDHEVLGEDLVLIFGSIEDSFAVFGESGKLFSKEIFREGDTSL